MCFTAHSMHEHLSTIIDCSGTMCVVYTAVLLALKVRLVGGHMLAYFWYYSMIGHALEMGIITEE